MKNLSFPKKTFWNLTEDKQQKIEAALVAEFATNGYQKASLNSVVKKLGIAKGSLYQYFDNKEAIFLFVFDKFTALVKKMAGKPDQNNEKANDIWEMVQQLLMAGLIFIDRYPHYYQLYLNILLEKGIPHRHELIARVRLFSMDYFGPLVEAGQKEGRIRDDIKNATIVFMIDAAIDRFLQGYARSYLDGGLGLEGKSKKELALEIGAINAILKNGIRGE